MKIAKFLAGYQGDVAFPSEGIHYLCWRAAFLMTTTSRYIDNSEQFSRILRRFAIVNQFLMAIWLNIEVSLHIQENRSYRNKAERYR
jgi:hypothetical protein